MQQDTFSQTRKEELMNQLPILCMNKVTERNVSMSEIYFRNEDEKD